jgi:hypothetical protein
MNTRIFLLISCRQKGRNIMPMTEKELNLETAVDRSIGKVAGRNATFRFYNELIIARKLKL